MPNIKYYFLSKESPKFAILSPAIIVLKPAA